MSGRPGALVRGLIHDGGVRVLSVVADGPAEELRRRHELNAPAARLCAEGLVAGALLAAHVKDEERLMVQVQGQDPRFSFASEVDAHGAVRGWLRPTSLPEFDGLKGYLTAVKSNEERELYRGVSPVDHQGFEGALNAYLTQSQQTLGLVRVSSRFSKEGEVRAASGLLVERMGDGMDPEAFLELIEPLRTADLGEVMMQLAFGMVLGSEIQLLENRRLEFKCRCSLEKVERTLISLGPDELRAIAEEQGQAEVVCHFCAEAYAVPRERLLGLAEMLEPKDSPGV